MIMKHFNQWLIYKLLSQLNQSLSFNRACILSIILHGVLFCIFAFVIHITEAPNLYTPPLVFDFVFAPDQNYDKSSLSQDDTREVYESFEEYQQDKKPESTPVFKPENNKTKEKPRSRLFDQEAPKSSRSSDLTSVEIQTNLGASEAGPSKTEQEQSSAQKSMNATYVPEEESVSNFDNSFVISAKKIYSLSLPRTNKSQPDLIPAKIAMTAKQHKMLQKKFKKWSEDLNRLDMADSTIVWKHKGKLYSARLHHIPAKTETGIDEVLIEVTSKEKGYNISSKMRMKRLAFSNYAQFVDFWDPWVAIHNDVLDGRFHTNTTFNVSQSRGIKPTFNGKVTTSSYEIRSSGSLPFVDVKAIFLGGIETGVKEINLPGMQFPFIRDTVVSVNNVHTFDEEAWITFHGDGSFSWKTASEPNKVSRQVFSNESFYIVGSKKKTLHLKGIVNGKVLVYSPGKIIIDNDITYARHPEIDLDSDDYLGLVSGKDIEIAHPRITGPGDLYVFASIYAKGRFRVRHLRGRNNATLYIYGSMTAGSLSATEPRYATKIRFDKRLQSRRPPNFPMTDRYEIIDWDDQWEVKQD